MTDGELQIWDVAEPYINLNCKLGEGPFFEKQTNSLRFVDIIEKRIHYFSLSEGPSSLKTLQLEEPVSVTADVRGCDPRKKILIGVKYGLALLDRGTGKYEYFNKFTEGPGDEAVRSNDGAVDPHGRFWLGSMTDFGHGDFKPVGSLFLFRGMTSRSVVRAGLTIPNAIGWSPDLKTMYFTHTTENKIFAFDYSSLDGAVTNERVHYHHDGTGGLDGFRVDVEGNLWHAIYGEGRVIKISPSGTVVGEIRLPTRNITCPEFVGTELFITTAADDEAEGGRRSKECGGGLYRIDVGVEGVGAFEFRLEES
jgi:sugar lactone lactonase YvrE